MKSWIFQKKFSDKIKKELDRIRPLESLELKKYRDTYENEFRISKKSNWVSLLEKCHEHELILVGDIHTLLQAPRTFIRICRNIRGIDYMIALELFTPEDDKHLDRYIAGQITLDQLYSQSAFPVLGSWNHYAQILEFAKLNKIRVIGVNLPNSGLRKRDQYIGEILGNLNTICFCLIGNYHLAYKHLPKEIFSENPEKKVLRIFQNNEKIWWKEAKTHTETDVFSLGKSEFLIQSVPPWIINLSYLNYLTEGDDETDNISLLNEILKTLYELLEAPPINLDSIEFKIFMDYNFEKDISPAMSLALRQSTSYFDGELMLIPSLNINHLSDASAKLIYYTFFRKVSKEPTMNELFMVEAFSFFLSLLINPQRKAPTLSVPKPSVTTHGIQLGKIAGYNMYLRYCESHKGLKYFLTIFKENKLTVVKDFAGI